MQKSEDNCDVVSVGPEDTSGGEEFHSITDGDSRKGSISTYDSSRRGSYESSQFGTRENYQSALLRDPRGYVDPYSGSMLRKTPNNVREIMKKYLSSSAFTLEEMERELPPSMASVPPRVIPRYKYQRQLSTVRRNLENEIDEVLNASSSRMYSGTEPAKKSYSTTHARSATAYTARSKPQATYVAKKPYLEPLVVPRTRASSKKRMSYAEPTVHTSSYADPSTHTTTHVHHVHVDTPIVAHHVPATTHLTNSVSLMDLSHDVAREHRYRDTNGINPRYRFDALYKLTRDYGWEDNSSYKSDILAPKFPQMQTFSMYTVSPSRHDTSYDSGIDISAGSRRNYYQAKKVVNPNKVRSTSAYKNYSAPRGMYRSSYMNGYSSVPSTPRQSSFKAIKHQSPIEFSANEVKKPSSRKKLNLDIVEDDKQINNSIANHNGDVSGKSIVILFCKTTITLKP